MRTRFIVALVLVALAALPAAAQTINGCVDTNKGTLRITKPGEPCDAKEYAISWNQQGVAGKDGKDGAPGAPGLQGVAGPEGSQGPAGRDGLNCQPPAPPAPTSVGTIDFVGIAGGPFTIYQYSGGATNTVVLGGGGGSGAGKVNFSNIIVVRKVDAASPHVLHAVAAGQHLQKVTINLTPGTAGPRTVVLEDVFVTSYSFTKLEGSNDVFETVAFDFAKITATIDGVTTSWDLKTNSGV